MTLIVLNILTYDKILQFEQTLSNQVRVCFNAKRPGSSMPRQNSLPHLAVAASSSSGAAAAASRVENADHLEMIQLVSEHEADHEVVDQNSRSPNLLTRIKRFAQ